MGFEEKLHFQWAREVTEVSTLFLLKRGDPGSEGMWLSQHEAHARGQPHCQPRPQLAVRAASGAAALSSAATPICV